MRHHIVCIRVLFVEKCYQRIRQRIFKILITVNEYVCKRKKKTNEPLICTAVFSVIIGALETFSHGQMIVTLFNNKVLDKL